MHKEENKVIVQTVKKLGINPTSEIIRYIIDLLQKILLSLLIPVTFIVVALNSCAYYNSNPALFHPQLTPLAP